MSGDRSSSVIKDGTDCVFVIGAPRSGTSALAWAIAQHPDMWTGPEMDFPYYFCRNRDGQQTWEVAAGREDGWLAKHEVNREEFMAAIGLGLDRLILSRSGGLRWIDSTPANTLVASELAQCFPNAKFIHIIRDGRAVVNSLIRSGFDIAAAKNFKTACRTWTEFVQAGRKATRSMPDRVMEIRQEAMRDEPDRVMDAVQRFLNLEVVADPAAFLRSGHINSSYGNRKPEDIRTPKPAVDMPSEPWQSWERSEQVLFSKIARPVMREVGYDLPVT